MLTANGQPLPRSPVDVREDLEKLREKLKEGEIDNRQYAAMSARFIDELRKLMGKRKRVALT